MLEELKVILDLLGDVSGIAGWLLGGFILFKLTIWLSTAGMVYKLTSLAIEKLHSLLITRKTEQPVVIVTEYKDKLNNILCGEDALPLLMSLLRDVRAFNNIEQTYKSGYIHGSDLRILIKAYDDYKVKIIAEKQQKGKS